MQIQAPSVKTWKTGDKGASEMSTILNTFIFSEAGRNGRIDDRWLKNEDMVFL